MRNSNWSIPIYSFEFQFEFHICLGSSENFPLNLFALTLKMTHMGKLPISLHHFEFNFIALHISLINVATPHQDRCSHFWITNDVNSTTKQTQPQKYAFELIDEANDDIIIIFKLNTEQHENYGEITVTYVNVIRKLNQRLFVNLFRLKWIYDQP